MATCHWNSRPSIAGPWRNCNRPGGGESARSAGGILEDIDLWSDFLEWFHREDFFVKKKNRVFCSNFCSSLSSSPKKREEIYFKKDDKGLGPSLKRKIPPKSTGVAHPMTFLGAEGLMASRASC